MKRAIVLMTAIVLLMAFSGCTPGQNKTTSEPTGAVSGAVETAGGSTGSAAPADAKTVSKAYETYSGVKTEFLAKLTEALAQNRETAVAAMSLLSLVSVELDLIPIALLGQGEQAIAIGLAIMGATDVKHEESGGNHSISYADKNGTSYLLSVAYDAGADALVCINTKDGKENIYAEYQKTGYGYAAQYYIVNEKGEGRLYQLSLSGEDGVVGVSKNADKPSALTGGESADFPKACSEWYATTGKTVTALPPSGVDLNFEYVPASA